MDEVRWVDTLVRDAIRFRLVFVHLGTAFSSVRESLFNIEAYQMDAEEFCQNGFDIERPDSIVILKDIERLRRNRRATLGQFREQVIAAADADRSVVLVSSVSKDSFEISVGSDLIHDARQHFVRLAVPPEDSLSCLRATAQTTLDDNNLIRSCLEEIGYRTLESVSQVLWEHAKSPNEAIAECDYLTVSALRGAGLIAVENDVAKWTVGSVWKQFRYAVAEVASARIQPSARLGTTFIDLWVVERVIRNRFREELKKNMGAGWRESCIAAHLRSEVLSRARLDAHPRAESLNDLRDPLEWLSLSELLDLRETHQLGELGLESYLWTKFRSVIVPLRNRVSHMRLLDEEDARQISSWKAIIQRKLAS